MCGICGVIYWQPSPLQKESFAGMLDITARRGRDSTGIVTVRADAIDKSTAMQQTTESEIHAAIAVCRAEPTTEVSDTQIVNTPPFVSCDGHWIVAHNGVVSNDKQLRQRYGSVPSAIDSAILPEVFAATDDPIKALALLEGSFAIAAYRRDRHQALLYRDFQPLWYAREAHALYFASESSALPGHLHAREIPPYSGLFMKDGNFREFTIDKRPPSNKIYVIHSGGLDSTVVLAEAAQQPDREITAIYINYSPRVNEREQRAAQQTAQVLGCNFHNIEVPWLAKLGGSPLTDLSLEIAEGEQGAEFAHEWVPARNTLFIALIAAMCDANNVYDIRLGLNLEEAGAYPDNTVEFYRKMESALAIGTMSRPAIHCPLAYYTKKEIVTRALQIRAPVEYSYSCYTGHEKHCGKCGPCYMRRMAFRLNGVVDPVEYESIAPNFWRGCAVYKSPHLSGFSR